MKINPLPLNGSALIEGAPIGDERGRFMRLYCAQSMADNTDLKKPIAQINHSYTAKRGTVRGMHYQKAPALEAKIVRCLKGKVFDVMVDLRASSPDFLKHHAVELSSKGQNAVYIPEGFAHGFQTLEDDCELLYLHTAPYTPAHEGGLHYNDPRIGISWPLPIENVSARDARFTLLTDDFKGITS
jgi:dTDP-4-dehydrorhamnose 3,5-epimerase